MCFLQIEKPLVIVRIRTRLLIFMQLKAERDNLVRLCSWCIPYKWDIHGLTREGGWDNSNFKFSLLNDFSNLQTPIFSLDIIEIKCFEQVRCVAKKFNFRSKVGHLTAQHSVFFLWRNLFTFVKTYVFLCFLMFLVRL